MRPIGTSLLLLFLLLINSSVFSLNANLGNNFSIYEDDDFKVSAGVSFSMLQGETREKVYNVGPGTWDRKISELVWKLDDVVMSGMTFSCQYNNRFYLNFGAWTEVSSSKSRMTDSDWLNYSLTYYYNIEEVTTIEEDDEGEEVEVTEEVITLDHVDLANYQTHLSVHDTSLEKGEMMDINFAVTLLDYSGEEITSYAKLRDIDSDLTIQALIGYKKDTFKWSAKGGHYWYYGEAGYFDSNVVGIDYEHEVKVPYIGIAFNLNIANFGVNGFYNFSSWAEAEDVDNHYLRSIKYNDTFEDAEHQEIGVSLKWDFTRDWTVAASYQYDYFDSTRGNMKITDTTTGTVYKYPGTSGLEHENTSYTVSFTYHFA